MKYFRTLLAVFCLAIVSRAQSPKSVTVPITLDHNRVVIDVYLPLVDGTSKRMRALVDTGTSDLMMSQRTGALFGELKCEAQSCAATPPKELVIGGMKISLAGVSSAHTPVNVPKDFMVPGMSPEITLPSTVLRNYDVVFDYANRQFTIGEPGSVRFQGTDVKARISPPGLIQASTIVEGETHTLELNTGVSISFVASDLLARWHAVHPTWPYMKGSVAAANMFGTPDEIDREVLQIPSLRLGSGTLGSVLVASYPIDLLQQLQERAGKDAIGLVGGEALRNYRVGIDYAHQQMYLDLVGRTPAEAVDVVGLTLRPETEGGFTIVGVPDGNEKPIVPDVKSGDVLIGVDGAPASGATLGQVWSLLGGTPGQIRTLTLERDGKRFTVDAPVRRFLDAKGVGSVKAPRRNPHRRN